MESRLFFTAKEDAYRAYQAMKLWISAESYNELNDHKNLADLKRTLDSGNFREDEYDYILLSAIDSNIYPEDGAWIVNVIFEEESFNLKENLFSFVTGFLEILELKNIKPPEFKENAIFSLEDYSEWPEPESNSAIPETTEQFNNEYLFVCCPKYDGDNKQLLNNSEIVLLADAWHSVAGIPFINMHVSYWYDSGDGDLYLGNLNQFNELLLGLSGCNVNYMSAADLSYHAKEHSELPTKIIKHLVSKIRNECKLDIRNLRINLTSKIGTSVSVFTNKKLVESELRAISESIKSSYFFSVTSYIFSKYFSVLPFTFISECGDYYENITDEFDQESPDRLLVSLTDALKLFEVKISAVKANKLLVEKGILKELKVRGVKSPKKSFKDNDSIYGINVEKSNRKNDIEARYYLDRFNKIIEHYLA